MSINSKNSPFILRIDEKQIQSLKEQSHRYHMEEMMVKLKVEQMRKMTENECEKVYTLAQQRDELTAVSFTIIITIRILHITTNELNTKI